METQPAETIYHIARNGKVIAKYDFKTLYAKFKEGAVKPTDHYIIEGTTDWRLVGTLKSKFAANVKFNWRILVTHTVACITGALAYAFVSAFYSSNDSTNVRIIAGSPVINTTKATIAKPLVMQPPLPTASTIVNSNTAPSETQNEVVKEKATESDPTPQPIPLAGRFERLEKSPIKLSAVNPSNKGPFRISGCIASTIDTTFLSWPVNVNDELPQSSYMISTFEQMEERSIQKPVVKDGNGALALTFVIENKSKYVVNSPVLTASLVDEHGDKIASGSYTGQPGAPFVKMAPGDRACYRLVLKCSEGKTLDEKAAILAKFSKVEFAMYLGSDEVKLTQSEWIEAAPK
jgi:hypothetical protein